MSIYFKNLDLSKLAKKPQKSCNSPSPFPIKLYLMLQEVAKNGKEDIISWAPDGLSFQVHDSDRFLVEILPSYFRQTQFKSFQRQLSFYRFKRSGGAGPLNGRYSHTFFIRGNMEMCKKITRVSNHRKKKTESSAPDGAIGAPLKSPPAEDERKPTANNDSAVQSDDMSSSGFSFIFDSEDDASVFSAFGEAFIPEDPQMQQQRIVPSGKRSTAVYVGHQQRLQNTIVPRGQKKETTSADQQAQQLRSLPPQEPQHSFRGWPGSSFWRHCLTVSPGCHNFESLIIDWSRFRTN